MSPIRKPHFIGPTIIRRCVFLDKTCTTFSIARKVSWWNFSFLIFCFWCFTYGWWFWWLMAHMLLVALMADGCHAVVSQLFVLSPFVRATSGKRRKSHFYLIPVLNFFHTASVMGVEMNFEQMAFDYHTSVNPIFMLSKAFFSQAWCFCFLGVRRLCSLYPPCSSQYGNSSKICLMEETSVHPHSYPMYDVRLSLNWWYIFVYVVWVCVTANRWLLCLHVRP